MVECMRSRLSAPAYNSSHCPASETTQASVSSHRIADYIGEGEDDRSSRWPRGGWCPIQRICRQKIGRWSRAQRSPHDANELRAARTDRRTARTNCARREQTVARRETHCAARAPAGSPVGRACGRVNALALCGFGEDARHAVVAEQALGSHVGPGILWTTKNLARRYTSHRTRGSSSWRSIEAVRCRAANGRWHGAGVRAGARLAARVDTLKGAPLKTLRDSAVRFEAHASACRLPELQYAACGHQPARARRR